MKNFLENAIAIILIIIILFISTFFINEIIKNENKIHCINVLLKYNNKNNISINYMKDINNICSEINFFEFQCIDSFSQNFNKNKISIEEIKKILNICKEK